MNTIWTKRALANLETEFNYYGRINPSLAREFTIIVLQGVKNIALMPGAGRPGKRIGTRELIIDKYPYIIAYRVRAETLEILAVIHQKRKNIKSFY